MEPAHPGAARPVRAPGVQRFRQRAARSRLPIGPRRKAPEARGARAHLARRRQSATGSVSANRCRQRPGADDPFTPRLGGRVAARGFGDGRARPGYRSGRGWPSASTSLDCRTVKQSWRSRCATNKEHRCWLVLERGIEPYGCFVDPLLDESRYVYVEAGLTVMLALARGRRSWADATADGSIAAFGDPDLIRQLPSWFQSDSDSTERLPPPDPALSRVALQPGRTLSA